MATYEIEQEHLSKQLFGRRHRIHVMRAVLDISPSIEDTFSFSSLTNQMRENHDHLSPSVVQQELSGLEILQMIRRATILPSRPGTSKWLQRTDSPLWSILPPIEAALRASQND